jgi:Stress responsive A/B Barrel Domain
MIRHTVIFRWKAEATAEQRQRVATELSRLPALVPTLRSYELGSDLGVNEGNFDFAVSASFDDLDGYLAYRDHPVHRAIIREHISPLIQERAAVQFEVS